MAPRRSPSWIVGGSLSLLAAIAVAACGLAGGDGSSDPGGTPSATTEIAAGDPPPATEPPPATAPAATIAPAEPTTTVPPATSSTTTTTTEPIDDGPLSFAGHVEPVVRRNCARCHTGDGPGTQHVRFDTAADLVSASGDISLVVETGLMPPWPAGDLSVPFDHDWSLTDRQIARIVEWDAGGAPLDVPDDAPMSPTDGVVGLDDPDVTMLASGSYDGVRDQPDEYRCFVYDPMVAGATAFVGAMEFVPQQTQVVHHAVGFRLSAEDRAQIDQLDGADGQGGWSCFGFSPGRSAEIVFTWAPGQGPTRFPTGSGLALEPGAFFVMQTHYHFDVEAPPDRSTFALEWAEPESIEPVALATYLAPAEIPCSTGESGPRCDRATARAELVQAYGPEGVLADALVAACGYDLADFAGMTDGTATSSCDQPIQAFGEIVSVFGHMHELGAAFRMTLNPDTPEERILLDIPTWDFNWQLIYEPTESIILRPGDWIRIECTWDRALRDESLEPAYVMWADGTDDEMCFSAVVTR